VAAKPEPKVVLIELGDMHFGFDQSSLTPQGKEILAENVRILKANPDLNILVAGYASASGTEEYNQALSERRATAVRDALIAGGIAPERLTKIGYGQTRPATFEPYPADLESKAAKSNMRVLFTIIVD
jgi:outer membrane protein OmpA-like peptidoglycan-associated protein